MNEGLFGKSDGGLAGGLSGGLQMAAIALLVQQLMKHSRSEAPAMPAEPGPQAAPTQPDQSSGGLGDILGGLLGSAGGGILGGLGGLLGGLRNQGMDHKVDSWVRPGPNQSVSADELSRAFDPKDVEAAAQKAGTDRGGLMQEVSRILPDFVDRMTPQGRMPERESDLGGGGLGGLLGSLFGGTARDDGPRR